MFKTKTIGVNLLVTIVDSSWTVSCLNENLNTRYNPYANLCTHKLPSPTKRMVLPNCRSLAAQAAPRVAPTLKPILPHKTCVISVASLGRGTSMIPKPAVPVSAMTISFGFRNCPTRGHKYA